MIAGRMASDARLGRLALAGRRESVGTLIEHYRSLDYHVAMAHLGDRSDAEDIVQDSFLKAFQSLDTLRDARKFSHWLLTIARNRCRDLSTKRRRESVLNERAEGYSAAEPTIAREEAHRILWEHIRQLEEPQREVLVLHSFDGKSVKAMASQLDISPDACAKRLQRVRAVLGNEIVQTLGTRVEGAKSPEPFSPLSKRNPDFLLGDSRSANVHCYFDGSNASQLDELEKGDSIAITGIAYVSEGRASMLKCQIAQRGAPKSVSRNQRMNLAAPATSKGAQ